MPAGIFSSISTASIRKAEQLEFWRAIFEGRGTTVTIIPDKNARGFNGFIKAGLIGGSQFSYYRCSANATVRTRQNISADSDLHYLICIPLSGDMAVECNHQVYSVRHGEYCILNMAYPMRTCTKQRNMLSLKVDQKCLPFIPESTPVWVFDQLHCAKARWFKRHMFSLIKQISLFGDDKQGLAQLENETYALIEQLFGMIQDEGGYSHLKRQLFIDICQFIDHNYWREIQIADIESKLNISRSYIFRVLAEHKTSFRELLSLRRVNASINHLSSNDFTGNLLDLALLSGFSNQSHFSRSFADEFSLSPSKIKRWLEV